MPKKVTPKDYINKCKVQGYDLPIENYISAKVKIKHKCSKGHIYEQTPSSHLSGKGCPKCKNIKLSIYKKRTPEEYYNECKEKDLDLPIEKYKGNSIKIKHKCIRNHIYEQRPHDHLQGQGCPKCSRNYSYTPKEYYQECKSKGIDIPIEDYIDTKTKIKHKCSKCGNIYEQTPNKHLIRGHGCPKCGRRKMIISRTGKNKKKTPEEYYNECKSKGYDLPIENYINNSIKIKHKCIKGHTYSQSPNVHLQGQGCPICNESHGEKHIRNYLVKKYHDRFFTFPAAKKNSSTFFSGQGVPWVINHWFPGKGRGNFILDKLGIFKFLRIVLNHRNHIRGNFPPTVNVVFTDPNRVVKMPSVW